MPSSAERSFSPVAGGAKNLSVRSFADLIGLLKKASIKSTTLVPGAL